MEPCKIHSTTQRRRSRTGAGRQGNTFSFQSREKNVLDMPSYRSGGYTCNRLVTTEISGICRKSLGRTPQVRATHSPEPSLPAPIPQRLAPALPQLPLPAVSPAFGLVFQRVAPFWPPCCRFHRRSSETAGFSDNPRPLFRVQVIRIIRSSFVDRRYNLPGGARSRGRSGL
jgi:hypothetical protein